MTSNSTANTAENKHNGETALLSPDGRLLAVPGECNTVVVLDALTNEPWATYYSHQAGLYRRVAGPIRALMGLLEAILLPSGSTDESIHIWHARSGIHQCTLTQPQEGCAVLALALPHDELLPWSWRGKDDNSWQLV